MPASFALGSWYLLLYILGIALALYIVVNAGSALFAKLLHISDERGLVKKVVGALFMLLGIGIIFGVEKKIEIFLLNQGYDITRIELLFSAQSK